MYYEVKVQYLKTDESGKEKKVTEAYLAQTETCADAENLVCEELAAFVSTEIRVKSVKQSSIEDLIAFDNGFEKNFLIKVNFLSMDEVTGVEKKEPHIYLTSAEGLQEACKRFLDEVARQQWCWDGEFVSVIQSAIVDVYKRV
jgi:hypothetical protein